MVLWETIRFVIVDLLISIIYFPVWWYTVGLKAVALMVWKEVKGLALTLNLKLLFSFMLKPMFGQSDIWGRIISFYVRIFHFLFLFIYALVVTLLWSTLLIIWILLPPFLIINILFNLGLNIPFYG